jgi:hypothetical protein
MNVKFVYFTIFHAKPGTTQVGQSKGKLALGWCDYGI